MVLGNAVRTERVMLADKWAKISSTDKYLIVGAGPSGLGTARSFLEAGIPFEGVEKHTGVGGIWDMENAGTSMYKTANFISSKTKSAFASFPMPDAYPDYPTREQILAYVQSFSEHHHIGLFYSFGTAISDLSPDGDDWLATFEDGRTAKYKGVVLANGFQWDPNLPSYSGEFSGESYHSKFYEDPDQFRDKRVLIVGGGNSAVDIACDAAFMAKEASISMRRGYYFIPKHVGGVPVDTLSDQLHSEDTMPSGHDVQVWLKDILDEHVGDITRLGLQPPVGLPLEHHPIANSQILHYLSHGRITARPDIERLDGQTVHFFDGQSAEFDTIVYCTGYRDSFPMVKDDVLCGTEGKSDMFINIFHRRHQNLFVTGLLQTDSGGYWISDLGSDLVANHILDMDRNPQRAKAFREQIEGADPDLTAGFSYQHNERHSAYINGPTYAAYMKSLAEEMGWSLLSFGTTQKQAV